MNNKTLIIICLCAFSYINLQAQIQIFPKDLPNINTVHVLSSHSYPDIEIDKIPGERTWDYSYLDNSKSLEILHFESANSEPGFEFFGNAEFARTASLGSIVGLNIDTLLPLALPNPTAFYHKGKDGNVYFLGLDTDLDLGEVVDLGRQNLIPDAPYKFWSAGKLGLNYSSGSTFVMDVNADETEFDLPGFISYIRLNLTFNSQVNIDAFGTLILPDSTYEVLRYNEFFDIHVKFQVFGEALGVPYEIPVDDIPNIIWSTIGVDPNEVGLDTTFKSQFHRFYTEGMNYPVASINYDIENGETLAVASIDFITSAEPAEGHASFAFKEEETDCRTIHFTNNSVGPITDQNWEFGEGTSSGDEMPSFTYPEFGAEYMVKLSIVDTSGAVNIDSQLVTICTENINSAIFDLNENEQIFCFPNPVNDLLTIKFDQLEEQYFTIELFSIEGKLLSTIQSNNKIQTIPFDGLNAGTYFIKILNKENKPVLFEKVLKVEN